LRGVKPAAFPGTCKYDSIASVSCALLLATILGASMTTAERGPAVGQPLPPFSAPDQDGRLRSFEDLRGPQGLILVFFRSADW
jgi:hypothetical protein